MHWRMHFNALTIKMKATFLAPYRRYEYNVNANIQIYEKQLTTTHLIFIPFPLPRFHTFLLIRSLSDRARRRRR
jgi:hypothetical protein